MTCKRLLENLIRKKPHEAWLPEIPLKRCFTTVDLISLGVGTTVGAGLYVVIGELARDKAGPSVVISVILASFAAMLCALSFAEYGSRFPDAGSSYIYTYATLGEVWAFVVGWNIVLEFLLAGASFARTCSALIDSASNGKLFLFFTNHLSRHWNVPGKGTFPDLLAAVLVLAVVAILCMGARSSTNFHNLITAVNVIVVVFMIVYGIFFANVHHWTHNFFPRGVHGVLRGAAITFFPFSGFDVVAEAAEEAIDPEKNVPRSYFLIIIISTLAYVGVAAVLTLMVPYHALDKYAPLADAFERRTFHGAKYIILCGGICATISALFCAVYSTSRIVYSMSFDGLLFRWFSKVHTKTQVPCRAILVAGVITAILALVFNVNQLVELLAIGTLVAYTKVTISVLVSRYQPGVQSVHVNPDRKTNITEWLQKLLTSAKGNSQPRVAYRPIINEEDSKSPSNSSDSSDSQDPSHSLATEGTASRAELAMCLLVVGMVALAVTSTYLINDIQRGEWFAIFLVCLFAGIIIVSLVAIQLQPKNPATFPFMVPCVPYIPALTIFINIVLLANLQKLTYIRFGVWMVLGFIIYLFYGYRHSSEAMKPIRCEEGDVTVVQETPEIEQNISAPQPQ